MLLLYPWLYNIIPGCSTKTPDGRPTVYCDFAAEAGDLGLIFFLGCTYMIVAPAIMFACMIYFGLATFVYMWLFAYAYDIEFEGKGGIWYVLSDGIMVGFMAGLLCGVALFYAFAPLGVEYYLMWGLFVAQLIFYWHHCRHRFPQESQILTFEEAVVVDYEWRDEAELMQLLDPDYYKDPLLPDEDNPGGCYCCAPCMSDDDGQSDSNGDEDDGIYYRPVSSRHPSSEDEDESETDKPVSHGEDRRKKKSRDVVLRSAPLQLQNRCGTTVMAERKTGVALPVRSFRVAKAKR